MADKKRQAHVIANSLSDVLVTCILPPDRRLYFFEERPLWMLLDGELKSETTPGTLLYLWHFEGLLKMKIMEFIKFLETSANDELDHIAKSAINSMYTIVSSVPENERLLIKILCNKMGDARRGPVASLAGHHIESLANDNPNMVPYLVRQVSDATIKGTLGRSAANARSYLHFLSRVPLNKKLSPVARDLISLYAVIISRTVGYEDEIDTTIKKIIPEGKNKEDLTRSEKKRLAKYREKKKLAIGEANNAALKLSLIGMKRAIPFAELAEYPLSDSTIHTLVDTAYRAPLHISTLIISLLQKIGGDASAKSAKLLYHLLKRPDVSEHAQMKLFKCFSEIASEGKELDAKYPNDTQVALTKRLVLSSAFGSIPFAVTCTQTLNNLPSDLYGGSGKFFGSGPTYVHGKENPAHSIVTSKSGKTPVWELELLRRHINPTVSFCAQSLVSNKKGNNNSNNKKDFYDGDAYADFTFTSFVDRLCTRNIRAHAKRDEGLFSQFKRRGAEYVAIPELNIFWKPSAKKSVQHKEKEEIKDIDDFLLNEMRKRGMLKDDDDDDEINGYEGEEDEEEQFEEGDFDFDEELGEEEEEEEEEEESSDEEMEGTGKSKGTKSGVNVNKKDEESEDSDSSESVVEEEKEEETETMKKTKNSVSNKKAQKAKKAVKAQPRRKGRR